MNKTWSLFMGLAVILLIAVFVYEIYISLSGGNVNFTKTVTPIENSLYIENIDLFNSNYDKILVKTEDLDNK